MTAFTIQQPNMIAIDFETANYDPASACAVGFAWVQDGAIVTRSHLIRPPRMQFEPRFIDIHHITPHMVLSAPTFAELWEEVSPLIVGQKLCAHNASFDRGVLNALVQHYKLLVPKRFTFKCTVALARSSFPHLRDHQLPTVARHLGIQLNHHDAASDAEACLRIARYCAGLPLDPVLP
jgi:DNA polymerase-3 subunit epsilon